MGPYIYVAAVIL